MKCFKLFLFIGSLFLLSYATKAGEMKFLWSETLDSGYVTDIEFMPDNDYFAIARYNALDVRKSETGELIHSIDVNLSDIEFTSDSSKMITRRNYILEFRDLNTLEVIQDKVMPNEEGEYIISYGQMEVDPVRPLLYLRVELSRYEEDQYISKSKIVIYNSETLEYVGELTDETHFDLLIEKIDISTDGKYFAAINSDDSRLMVWDLDTREQIVDHLMAPYYSTEWGEPRDLKFSKINTEKIYITGSFKHSINDKDHMGLSVYSISQKQIIDERFSQQGNQFGPAMLSFLNNENHILATVSAITRILDMHNGVFLYETIQSKNFNWGYNRYSKKKDIIIGHGYDSFSAGFYDFDSSVEDSNEDDVIYPNPTTNEVNIPFICASPEYTISVYDINGNNLTSQIHWQYTGELYSIDLSGVSAGVYVVRINCGGSSSDYRVVKES